MIALAFEVKDRRMRKMTALRCVSKRGYCKRARPLRAELLSVSAVTGWRGKQACWTTAALRLYTPLDYQSLEYPTDRVRCAVL